MQILESEVKATVPPSDDVTSGSGDARFRIPRSPQFKKRLLDKEIVSIKGMEQPREKKVKRAKKISFEEQLTKADMADRTEKKKEGRRSKNKSSMNDFMITKKYAKLNLESSSSEQKRKKNKLEAGEKVKPGPQAKSILRNQQKLQSEILPIKLVLKLGTVVGSAVVQPPLHKSETVVGSATLQTSVHKSETILGSVSVQTDVRKSETVKMSITKKPVSDQKQNKPEILPSNLKTDPNPEFRPKDSGSHPISDVKSIKLIPVSSSQVMKKPIPPLAENLRKLATIRRPSIEVKQTVRKSSLENPTKPQSRTIDLLPTEIDLERIVREPGRIWSKHLRQPCKPSEESKLTLNPLDSLPSTESLKLVLSGINPVQVSVKEDERPRDPRLHSSKLINQAKPGSQSQGVSPSGSTLVSALPSQLLSTPLITVSPPALTAKPNIPHREKIARLKYFFPRENFGYGARLGYRGEGG